MEKEFEEGEFWLPSEFLADDLFLESDKSVAGGIGPPVAFGFVSSLDSPVESVTETESDEEEYMAGLTRQMTRSFLLDDEKDDTADFAGENTKGNAMASSPQSTLCPMKWLSSSGHESPNGPSQVSSPPSSPLENQKDNPWDLLSEAAGQVMRMRMEDQGIHPSFQGLLGPPRKPSPPPISVPPNNPNVGFFSNPVHSQRQLQAAQFYHLRQQQLIQQQQQQKQSSSAPWGRQSRARSGEGDGRSSRPLGLSPSAWPPLSKPQQPGSGMRAVFLTSGAKRESAGTGVFLPRSTGTPTVPRKKPTCSTVLLPARVVQALNLNLDDLDANRRYPGGFILDRDALLGRSNAVLAAHQKRNNLLRPQPQAVSGHQEISLPQEWTY
ncbi:uncharacterized protein [Typha angustifolia]|uniref:uncharacterized protein n=1 Tax=Typha angustifolia TaxID=59011 RepID=UPI003C2C92A8